MTFLIRPPHRVKKSRTKNAQTILDRLKNFLDHNTDEPVEILCSFWEDQSNAVTYHELRDAVKTGEFNQKQFEEWQQDYSVLVAEKLTPIWKMAMAAGPAGQPLFDNLSFSINMQNPGIANWIKERGAEFVTSCSAEQKKAIQSLLAKKIVEEHTVDELARFIRPCIGLTDGDTKAVLKLYDSVAEKLKTEHPRMKPESIRKKALDAAQKYAEKKHRQRAFTIAQTELEFAYNRGADYGVRQAQEAGLLGTTRKRWITSGDDAVCPTCAALDGTEIEMDDSFDFKGRLLFAGQKMLPPAHPRCACAVEYIEDQNSIRTQITQTQPEEQPATDSLQMEGDVSDFARETAQTTKEVFFDKFGVQSNIDTIRMNDTDFTDLLSGTLAYVRPESPNVLHLNPLFFRDEESFYSSLGGRIRAYHRNASPGSIIAHEYAHSIENNLDSVAIVGDVAEEYIKKHPKDAMDMFLADYQVAGETISHYAGTTEHEFWSEAFGDVFANGENASEVSMNLVNRAKEILGIAKRRRNKLKKFSNLLKTSTESSIKEHKDVIKGRFKILKSDDDKRIAFGWASVAVRVDGEVIEDWQKDIVEPEELENAAYNFVELYREGGEMHERGGAAVLIESAVFTEEKMRAMGIPEGTIPVGWWIGFKVLDNDVWEKVKDGTYPMFSIEGEAERVEVEEAKDDD